MAYKRPMYCEYTSEHFKLYTPCDNLWMFVNVYAKYKETPVIFNWLRDLYKSQWMDEISAARRARTVVKDFFTMCEKLSNMGINPFKLSINVLDFNKYKDARKRLKDFHWCNSDKWKLWLTEWDISVINKD